MKRHSIECPHEEDVLAAVSTGRWPGLVDEALRRHVTQCEVCGDLLAVVVAFAREPEPAGPAPSRPALPEASAVWVRAQIHARVEATRLAERPITVAQAIAFASVVGFLGALFGAASPWLQGALRWSGAAVARIDLRNWPMPAGFMSILVEHMGLAALVGLCLMLAPVAVYWAVREPRV